MFAEFTELFSAHHCAGRQHFTSSVVPSLCGSLIVVAAWLSVKFAINNPHTITKLIIVRVPIVVFKIFTMRFLERGCVFCFLSHLVTLPSRASVILFSKKPPNYFAAACIDRGRIVLSIFVQIVTPQKRRLRHFCAALTVTRKFRLCLHPRGMLRVQSLHLPKRGLARHFLYVYYIIFQEKSKDILIRFQNISTRAETDISARTDAFF